MKNLIRLKIVVTVILIVTACTGLAGCDGSGGGLQKRSNTETLQYSNMINNGE